MTHRYKYSKYLKGTTEFTLDWRNQFEIKRLFFHFSIPLSSLSLSFSLSSPLYLCLPLSLLPLHPLLLFIIAPRPSSLDRFLLQRNKSCSPHHLVLTCTCGRPRDPHSGLEREKGGGLTPERGQESGSGVGGQEEVLSGERRATYILI